jgi:hypothetical protein
LLSALTLPRNPNEPEKDWLERVMADSKVQGRQAADRGTAIHGIIESYFDQVYLPEWPQYVRNIDKALIDAFGNQLWLSEKSFAHELGFGGKIDLSAQNLVVDFKTKETALDKVEPYHEHCMQIAAYCVGLGYKLKECRGAICPRTNSHFAFCMSTSCVTSTEMVCDERNNKGFYDCRFHFSSPQFAW